MEIDYYVCSPGHTVAFLAVRPPVISVRIESLFLYSLHHFLYDNVDLKYIHSTIADMLKNCFILSAVLISLRQMLDMTILLKEITNNCAVTWKFVWLTFYLVK